MKLFPLIVGIDAYTAPGIKALQGCVNDAMRIKKYIESDFVKNKVDAVDMRLLTNEKATKAGIVAAFEEVIKSIAANDIFFFYFSGHGVREATTAPVFVKAETDGGIETLVCIDSKVSNAAGYKEGTFLADKELRFLLGKIAAKGAKIFTVFDNCHSGDNTRALVEPEDKEGIVEARKVVLGTVAERAWEGFIFHQKIDKNAASLNEVMPLAPHIHISACRDIELAFEGPQTDGMGRGGNFTHAFTQIMQKTAGNISLYHLQTRLSNLLRRSDDKSQNPQVDMYGINPMAVHTTFLFGEPTETGEVYGYLDQTPQGVLQTSIGALVGAKKGMKVSIVLENDSTKSWEGTINKVTPGYSVVAVAGAFAYIKNESYRVTAKVENYGKVKLMLATDIDGGVAKATLEKHDFHKKYYDLVTVEDEADYVLRAYKENGIDFYRLTLPCDERPILLEIDGFLPARVTIVAEDMRQIAEWRFMKSFKHDENVSKALMDTVKVRMYQMDLSDKKDIDSARVEVPLNIEQQITTVYPVDKTQKGQPCAWIRFEIENTSTVDMYISFLMLSATFGIEPNTLALEEGVEVDRILLKPKQIVRTKSVNRMPGFFRFSLDEYITKDNWQGQDLIFKLIASTTPFASANLIKNDIPAPYSNAGRPVIFEDDEEVAPDFWFVKDVSLFFQNTQYTAN